MSCGSCLMWIEVKGLARAEGSVAVGQCRRHPPGLIPIGVVGLLGGEIVRAQWAFPHLAEDHPICGDYTQRAADHRLPADPLCQAVNLFNGGRGNATGESGERPPGQEAERAPGQPGQPNQPPERDTDPEGGSGKGWARLYNPEPAGDQVLPGDNV